MDISLLGFSAARELYNVHPLFVHFPAAFLPGALLLYGLGIALHRPALCAAGRACLYLAAAGGAAALISGLFAEGSFPHGDAVHRMMETHETLAWATLALAGALSAWSFFHSGHRPKAAWAFLGALALACLTVALGADLGARMVYLEGAAVKPVVEQQYGTGGTATGEGASGGHESRPHTH